MSTKQEREVLLSKEEIIKHWDEDIQMIFDFICLLRSDQRANLRDIILRLVDSRNGLVETNSEMKSLVTNNVGPVLDPLSPVIVDVDKYIDPKIFFQTSDNLWIQDLFYQLFVEGINAGSLSREGSFKVERHVIREDAFDSQIQRELGENFVFDDGEFCQIIIVLLLTQIEGGAGDLSNSGYSNIFYVRSDKTNNISVVRIYLRSFFRNRSVAQWSLTVSKLNDSVRQIEDVVFSRA